jgi:hypothetical protein
MKKSILLAAGLLALNLTPVFGQQPAMPPAPVLPPSSARQYAPPSKPPTPSDTAQLIEQQRQRFLDLGNPAANQPPGLTKFNLDFPGGTPKELVAAIEKATGKPLNAIIPDEDADLQMPPLKMNDVVVPQLFKALELASIKEVKVVTGSYFTGSGNQESYSTYTSNYGFKTDGQPTDSSVWYFHADTPPLTPTVLPQKTCQFYSLSPYLDRGFTVDDITTAIQTGWKMAGVTPTPELNYHKETKLLIAYGEPDKLKTIADVLKTLPPSAMTVSAAIEYEKAFAKLQSQIEELKKRLPTPAPSPSTTLEIKTGQ